MEKVQKIAVQILNDGETQKDSLKFTSQHDNKESDDKKMRKSTKIMLGATTLATVIVGTILAKGKIANKKAAKQAEEALLDIKSKIKEAYKGILSDEELAEKFKNLDELPLSERMDAYRDMGRQAIKEMEERVKNRIIKAYEGTISEEKLTEKFNEIDSLPLEERTKAYKELEQQALADKLKRTSSAQNAEGTLAETVEQPVGEAVPEAENIIKPQAEKVEPVVSEITAEEAAKLEQNIAKLKENIQKEYSSILEGTLSEEQLAEKFQQLDALPLVERAKGYEELGLQAVKDLEEYAENLCSQMKDLIRRVYGGEIPEEELTKKFQELDALPIRERVNAYSNWKDQISKDANTITIPAKPQEAGSRAKDLQQPVDPDGSSVRPQQKEILQQNVIAEGASPIKTVSVGSRTPEEKISLYKKEIENRLKDYFSEKDFANVFFNRYNNLTLEEQLNIYEKLYNIVTQTDDGPEVVIKMFMVISAAQKTLQEHYKSCSPKELAAIFERINKLPFEDQLIAYEKLLTRASDELE